MDGNCSGGENGWWMEEARVLLLLLLLRFEEEEDADAEVGDADSIGSQPSWVNTEESALQRKFNLVLIII